MGSFQPLGHWKLFSGSSGSRLIRFLSHCLLFFPSRHSLHPLHLAWLECRCLYVCLINTSSRLDTAERWMKTRGHEVSLLEDLPSNPSCLDHQGGFFGGIFPLFFFFLLPSVRFLVTCQPLSSLLRFASFARDLLITCHPLGLRKARWQLTHQLADSLPPVSTLAGGPAD